MHCQDFVDKEDDCIWERDVQALDVAIEAARKEIPKKVNVINIPKKYGSRLYHCPNCKQNLNWNYGRCEKCGQKLDWEA